MKINLIMYEYNILFFDSNWFCGMYGTPITPRCPKNIFDPTEEPSNLYILACTLVDI